MLAVRPLPQFEAESVLDPPDQGEASILKGIGGAWSLGIIAVIYNPCCRLASTHPLWSIINLVTIAISFGLLAVVGDVDEAR